jgi:hypothetical protein
VLVTNNTVDPNTPYRGAVAMTRELARARLLTVDGYGHGVLLNGSAGATRYIGRYLIKQTLPPKGTVCQQDQPPFADVRETAPRAPAARHRRSQAAAVRCS